MLKTAPRAAAGAKANITAPTKEAVVSKMENTSFHLSSLYTKKPTNSYSVAALKDSLKLTYPIVLSVQNASAGIS